MDYVTLAQSIFENCGGTKNIVSATHCATRLRIDVRKVASVQKEVLEKQKGVIGVAINGSQVQVIIGQDVPNLYRAFSKLVDVNSSDKKVEKKNIVIRVVETIAGIFTPILPALCGAGMLKAILVILTMVNIVESSSSTYRLIEMFSDSLFYFLPMFLAFTAAKKFDCNPFVAVSVGGILLHPTFVGMSAAGEAITFFGLNVPLITYASSVIPIIMTIWCMGYIERFMDKISPNAIKYFTVPVLTILITAPIALIVFGPLGNILGGWLSAAIQFMDSRASWLVITLMATFSPIIVMSGMHYSLFPIVFQSLATYGYTTLMSVSGLPSNMAQGGACFAVALRTKNKELRSMAISSGITAVMGISEPALYGVTLRLKRPLVAVMIAGGIGGLYASITFLRSFGMVSPGLAAFPIFIDPSGSNANIINFFITCLIGFVAAFVLTNLLGFEDVQETEEEVIANEALVQHIAIYAPVEGKIIPLSEVNDQVFSSLIMGKGIAIEPTSQEVYAPVDGKVTALFPSKHAIGITDAQGCEILIHLGIDTVRLNGRYFENFVQMDEEIKLGQHIASFDLESIKKEGYDMSVCVIVTNSKQYLDVVETQEKQVRMKEKIMEVI